VTRICCYSPLEGKVTSLRKQAAFAGKERQGKKGEGGALHPNPYPKRRQTALPRRTATEGAPAEEKKKKKRKKKKGRRMKIIDSIIFTTVGAA